MTIELLLQTSHYRLNHFIMEILWWSLQAVWNIAFCKAIFMRRESSEREELMMEYHLPSNKTNKFITRITNNMWAIILSFRSTIGQKSIHILTITSLKIRRNNMIYPSSIWIRLRIYFRYSKIARRKLYRIEYW